MAPRDLTGAVVVLTGASSGIGRAAARAFAAEGARLVLAARRGDVLEQAAAECRAAGAEAIAVPLDLTEPDAALRLRDAALAGFGRIDIWISNAGVGVIGRLVDAPLALHRKTLALDLLAPLEAAHAVLPLFEAQGRGTLIHTVSIGAWSPVPYAAAYCAAKFGLRGLTASLRQEYAAHPGIAICGIFPAVVDTPGLAHGANVTGKAINPGPFLYRAEQVADLMVAVARRPRAEAALGWPSRLAQIGHGLAPRLHERLTGRAVRRALARAAPGPDQPGAVLAPADAIGRSDGGVLAARGLPDARQLTIGALALLAAAIGGAAILRARRA